MVIDCFQLSKRKVLLKNNSKLKVGPKNSHGHVFKMIHRENFHMQPYRLKFYGEFNSEAPAPYTIPFESYGILFEEA